MAIDAVPVAAAFATGLAGSAHCALMCGGIATSLAAATNGPGAPSWRRAFALNAARVSGYTLAGLAAGAFGAWIGVLFSWADLAWLLRLLLGIALVLVGLRLAGVGDPWRVTARFSHALWRRLDPLRRALQPADTAWRRWLLGMLWGWLPCGLSASLLVASWLSGDALRGAATMAAFGAGTLVAMVPLTWTGARLGRNAARSRRLAAVLVIAAGFVVATAPWLAQHPTLARGLELLGCLPRHG